MTFDPFEHDGADEAQKDTTSSGSWEQDSDPASAPNQTSPAAAVSVTLKAGTGYEAPWIVIRGATVDHVAARLEDRPAIGRLITATDAAAKALHKAYSPSAAGSSSQQPGKPAGAEQAPDGQERYCKHGSMKYMSGISKSSGKPYRGFFCSERDRNEQCKPEFVK
ncbi:hypothetical protein JOD54_002144 [Actinokineospora baliensis]|uniref:hypothetical protein n=1 Tax=Actinokineospora baliensis TaxID=547056 RepID=UPI00195F16FA|nr:hypothetical protein [Actinokineospora baliensis]MBM7771940.1 hypothetical protein [Actinokineospora baliensis]